MSLTGLVTFVLLFLYMGTLFGSTPVFGPIFWSKFWLFTLVLLLLIAVPFLVVAYVKNADFGSDISADVRKASAVWLALLAVTILVLACAAAHSSHATWSYAPAHQSEQALVVGSFNVQQGHHLSGETNFDCVAAAISHEKPQIVGLQESDSVHAISGNINVLGAVASKLGLHRSDVPAGYEASVGVALLSQYEMRGKLTQKMPNAGAVNRFLTRATISVNDTDVTVFSVHTEWFGDPTVQIGFVAEEINKVKGPLVLVGDFNLDPSGQNDATIASNISTNGFQPLLDLESTGLKSATPICPKNCEMVTKGGYMYNPSIFTTVDLGNGATPGYQLDYIWYRGLEMVGDFIVSENSKFCSDHLYVQAAFVLPAGGEAETAQGEVPVTNTTANATTNATANATAEATANTTATATTRMI